MSGYIVHVLWGPRTAASDRRKRRPWLVVRDWCWSSARGRLLEKKALLWSERAGLSLQCQYEERHCSVVYGVAAAE